MIPLSTFNLLVVIDVLFIVYSIIDHRNRLYANIVIALLAGILSAFLSSVIQNDVVYEIMAGAVSVIDSPSISYFMLLVSTIMFAYTVFMVYEVLVEIYQMKKQSEQPRGDDE